MKNDIYNLVGKNIKIYRKKRNLTQRQLAEKLLLSESFIAKLESTTHQTVSLDTLEQIAHVLNIDIKDLFNKE
jgi:transcriptional regulator with XRE-family HTH domain